mmetsp:Transcript_41943/g.94764  ORF Transcript_41943/g.94764 Transcript_41943/m.94764 type:complete len:424 (+) Transcript_41943:248-1519(+)
MPIQAAAAARAARISHNNHSHAEVSRGGAGEALISVKKETSAQSLGCAGGFWGLQPAAKEFYARLDIQVSVALLIAANFITNIIQMQHWPTGVCDASQLYDEWKGRDCAVINGGAGCAYWGDCQNEEIYFGFEFVFNVAFTFELILNMYSAWFFNFWKDPWNDFDFIVVTVGLFGIAKVDLGSLSMLRMLRAFRVFRLFKRVKSLNKIMVSLASAVPGVINAFLILLLVMCIYAILATELFRDMGQGGKFTFFPHKDAAETERLVVKDYETTRSGDFGREYFGTFSRSLYTLFQVLTGESWSEAVARPLIDGTEYPFSVAIYFVTFNLICGVVLINVVVAVLLEKMVEEDEPEEEEEEQEELGPDDPLREITQLIKRLESSQAAQQSQQKNMQTDMAAVCAAMSNLSSAVNSDGYLLKPASTQ